MAPDRHIVIFRNGVDGPAETARLASVYGFIPRHIYTIINGFAAALEPAVVNSLRSETSVASVSLDRAVQPQ